MTAIWWTKAFLYGIMVICGYGRVGKYIGRSLEMAHIPFVVVEYNHTIVKHLREKGMTVVYGDPAEKMSSTLHR